jgi:hypothetical protein
VSNANPCFQFEDLSQELPAPGTYRGSISSARFRRSASDNRMLQVVVQLEGVREADQMVSDYFVLEGARVSLFAISIARRRLVALYRACGFQPKEGEEIAGGCLLHCRLEVEVEHEEWRGQRRLRVVGYRALEDQQRLPLSGLTDTSRRQA